MCDCVSVCVGGGGGVAMYTGLYGPRHISGVGGVGYLGIKCVLFVGWWGGGGGGGPPRVDVNRPIRAPHDIRVSRSIVLGYYI